MYIIFGDQTEFLQSVEIKKEVDFVDPFGSCHGEPVTYWRLIINGYVRDSAFNTKDFRILKGVYESIIEEIKKGTTFVHYGFLYRQNQIWANKKGSDSVE